MDELDMLVNEIVAEVLRDSPTMKLSVRRMIENRADLALTHRLNAIIDVQQREIDNWRRGQGRKG